MQHRTSIALIATGLIALGLLSACHRAPVPPGPGATPATYPGRPAFEQGYGQILQGDLRAGLAILKSITPEALSPRDRASRQAILDRFQPRKPQGLDVPEPDIQEPFTREVAALYKAYWTRCLLKTATLDEANDTLFAQLKACLSRHGKPGGSFRSLGELTAALGPLLEADGFHSLRGVTAPYHELMLWKKERVASYEVPLPESTQRVKVVFMSEFALQGWLGFATCGRSYSGGWTTETGLYCLETSYDLQSEEFRISYLAHEGQHFADNRRFPKLEQPELEYRAKLVELIQAKDTLPSLLDRFSRLGGPDRATPHPYANGQVALKLSKALFGDDSAQRDPARWATRTPEQVHAAALALLKESTRILEALGAAEVQQMPF